MIKTQKFKKVSLKVGDNVVVITGKNKGKTGQIRSILKAQQKIIVDGINKKFKHVKSQTENNTGEIRQIETPIHISNVKKI